MICLAALNFSSGVNDRLGKGDTCSGPRPAETPNNITHEVVHGVYNSTRDQHQVAGTYIHFSLLLAPLDQLIVLLLHFNATHLPRHG